VRAEVLSSGPLKAQPNPFQPLTEEGRAALQATVAELHAQFVAMVAAGRRMPVERVRELADGRVYTGRRAVELGLVDAIGGEREARVWLAAEKDISEEVPTRDLEWRSSTERVFSTGATALIKSLVSEWLGVDLVRAVWQPGS
jgi:protease-4